MNLSASSFVVFIFAGYFVGAAATQRKRADALLLNILPKEIAPILKSGQQTIADEYESASVLFVDLVGSTPLFAGLEPAQVVDCLNEVFSMFDQVIDEYGVEKIRTIGDNYMVAAGVPTRRPDHAVVLTKVALAMAAGLERLPLRKGQRVQFRLGIHSGPMIAGVIGKSKFQYDLWGDTVNLAARMESHGVPGRVQVSSETHELIKHDFDCECRGTIPIKGKGEMVTWFVLGPKSAADRSAAE
jgi:guanylate cyclase